MAIKEFVAEIDNLIKENESLCRVNTSLRLALKEALLVILQEKQEEFEKLTKIQKRDAWYKNHCVHCRKNSSYKPCKRLRLDTGKPVLRDNGEIYSIGFIGCSDFEWD